MDRRKFLNSLGVAVAGIVNVTVDIEDFTDTIGRNLKQPRDGPGFDSSATVHKWRSII